MNKPKIGYKVVEIRDGKYFSSSTNSSAKKRYHINRFVKRRPYFGALCLFKNLKDARKYSEMFVQQFVIFQAEYIPSEDKALWDTRYSEKLTAELLVRRYHCMSTFKKSNILFAEQIKLLKEVK